MDPLVGYAAVGALLASVLFFLVRAAWGGQQRAAASGPAYVERRDRSLGGRVVALRLSSAGTYSLLPCCCEDARRHHAR